MRKNIDVNKKMLRIRNVFICLNKDSMLESSSVCIGLKCSWNGISKQGTNKTNCDQSKLEEESILLSGPYGDDVAFVTQSDDHILIGIDDLFFFSYIHEEN